MRRYFTRINTAKRSISDRVVIHPQIPIIPSLILTFVHVQILQLNLMSIIPPAAANPLRTLLAEPNAPVSTATTKSKMNPADPNFIIDWSLMRAAVAISAARAQNPPFSVKGSSLPPPAPKLVRFLSSGVMISPTIGLTAGHSLDNTVDVFVYDAPVVKNKTKSIQVKRYKVHPDFAGNNFDGIDLAIFELDKPLALDQYFVPTTLTNQALKNEVLQRIGFGERDSSDGPENRRTWVLENYNRRITGKNYLTSQDRYGYAGDSGGPVFRTTRVEPNPLAVELLGIHVGRMIDRVGEPVDESNTLILNPEMVAWIQKTTIEWQSRGLPTVPAVTPVGAGSNR